MHKRFHLGILVIFLLTGWVGQASAAVLPLSPEMRGVETTPYLTLLEDPSRSLTIDQVRQPPWSDRFRQATPRSVNLGITKTDCWLRLDMVNGSGRTATWLFQVIHVTFDEVDFYFFPKSGPGRSLSVGDHRPFANRPVPHHSNVLPLEMTAGEKGTLYVRLHYQTGGAMRCDLLVWDQASFLEYQKKEALLSGMAIGGLLLVAVLNFFVWVRLKGQQYAWYMGYVLSVVLTLLIYRGFGYHYLWHEHVIVSDLGPLFVPVAMVLLAVQFARSFLDTPNNAPGIDRLLLAMAGLFVLPLVFYLLGLWTQGIKLSVISVLLTSVFPVIGYYLWYRGLRAARLYAVAWTVWTVGAFFAFFRYSGLIAYSPVTDSIPMLSFWIECVLLYLALVDRFALMNRKREEAERQYRQELEASKEQLESKVSERTEELELARRWAEALAMVDSLTGLFNRRAFLEKGGGEYNRAKRYGRDLALIMLDIDHFKDVNDSFGHAAGDEVLRDLCNVIDGQKRESDISGRLGGEEFAVLLPETNREQAAELAERLRTAASGLVVSHNGQEIKFTVSFGVTALTPEDCALDEIISRADGALYEAKNLGRNRVVIA